MSVLLSCGPRTVQQMELVQVKEVGTRRAAPACGINYSVNGSRTASASAACT